MSQSWHSRLEPWAVQPTIKIHDFPVALGIQGIFGTPPLRYIHNHPTRLVGLYIGLCLLLRSKVINLIFALVFTQAAFRQLSELPFSYLLYSYTFLQSSCNLAR
jgi:hypothetical protein